MPNQDLILHNEHQPLSLEEKHSFLQEDLCTEISMHGFEDVEWYTIPDELLLYIYLHTDTMLRKQRSERTNGYKASTLARHSTVIKQFLRFLHQKGMVTTDLTTKLAPVAQPTDELVDRDLHEHEVAQLLAYF